MFCVIDLVLMSANVACDIVLIICLTEIDLR